MYKCQLLSGVFPILIQCLLVILMLIALLIKRYLEYPQRKPLIFVLDISKQGFSSCVAHFANIIIAMIMSTPGVSTQCGWYFVSYTIDSLIGGLIVSIYLLKFLIYLANKYGWNSLKESGNYGYPDINYNVYIIQTVSWVIITILGRFVSALIIYIIPGLDHVVEFIDSLFNKSQFELTFVMVVCPITINILSVLIIDGF